MAYYAIGTEGGQPQPGITPQFTGGPDTYGYTWDDGVPYSWIDTTGGTNTGLSGWGGGTGPIALPFSFKYYDNLYGSVYISSYGYLSFHNYAWEPQDIIPDSRPPNDVIAPFWVPTYIPAGSWVHYQSGGIAPNRYFVVEWHNLAGGSSNDPYGGDDRYLFEVILHESGDIEFQYSTIVISGGYWWCGTAGIENSTGLDGLTYIDFCDNPTSFRGVHFYRPATGSFIDVSVYHWAYSWIERLYNAGITGGCGTNPLRYCPATSVTRDQMAVFLLRGIHGSAYMPPPATGNVFGDVPASYWAAAWIEQLAAEGITGGCGGGNYCPGTTVSRDQMAVFLLRAKYGGGYAPPAASGAVFSDVPASYWAAAWIERLAAEGITGGCGVSTYCPTSPVNRDQMAVFLVRTFNLP
jgi:hypothetical protein